jgi:hypothetical protein
VHRSLASLVELAERAITAADLLAGQVLWSAEPERPAAATAATMRAEGYTVAPVSGSWRRVTLADLDAAPDRLVTDVAGPVTEAEAIAGEAPLGAAVAALAPSPFLCVVEGGRIVGVLTRADLQLPPVSLVAFGFVVATERALAVLVDRYAPGEWEALLSAGRHRRYVDVLAERRHYDPHVRPVDCLGLHDLLAVARRVEPLRTALGHGTRHAFDKWAEPVKRLRDVLAHGGGLLDAQPDPLAAIEGFGRLRSIAEAVVDLADQPNPPPAP